MDKLSETLRKEFVNWDQRQQVQLRCEYSAQESPYVYTQIQRDTLGTVQGTSNHSFILQIVTESPLCSWLRLKPGIWYVSLRADILKALLFPEKSSSVLENRRRKKASRNKWRGNFLCGGKFGSFQVPFIHYWEDLGILNFAHVYEMHLWGTK